MNLDLVSFLYENHRGEVAIRNVRPIRIWFGSTCYHPQPGWLLECFDLDRQSTRDFAMSGIKGEWKVKQ